MVNTALFEQFLELDAGLREPQWILWRPRASRWLLPPSSTSAIRARADAEFETILKQHAFGPDGSEPAPYARGVSRPRTLVT